METDVSQRNAVIKTSSIISAGVRRGDDRRRILLHRRQHAGCCGNCSPLAYFLDFPRQTNKYKSVQISKYMMR